MDAARSLVAVALDSGAVPSVISAIVKQQVMERMRSVINHAMDIHGGHGICMGPLNHLGRAYQLTPVGITVEGANILTRTMIIFGQGAMRSHPFLLKEVKAVHDEDQKRGLIDFDDAFFSHMGFILSNVVRCFWFGISYAKFVNTPGDRDTQRYYRQLVKMSSAFALLADVCIGVLGGTLKRREKLSGRLADALSNMYVMSAALKHYENQGSHREDLVLLKWVCEDSLYNIQTALKGIMKNLPVPFVGRLCNFIIFPFTKPYHRPSDSTGHSVARKILSPGATLDRLSAGVFHSNEKDNATGRISHALNLVLLKWVCEDSLYNIQTALKGIMKNLPVPFVGRLCNLIIFPFTKPYHRPSDSTGHSVARKILSPGATLDRLSAGVFHSDEKDNATGRISHALNLVLKTEELQRKLRGAYKQGRISRRDRDAYVEAKDKNIITENEYNSLIEADAAVQNAIKVDEFSFSGWNIETP
jgi:hypothetical protein